MSNPIKNDGRERVPTIAKVKVKVSREGGEGELPYTITLTLDEVCDSFDYDVQLQFSSGNYDILPSSIEPSEFPMPSINVLYKIKTDYPFPQNEPLIKVGLIYSGEGLAPIDAKTDENVIYEYEGI